MWPGSEVKFEYMPNYVDKFNKEEELGDKLDRITQLFNYPLGKRPQLIMAYVPTIDTIGHKHGIHGEKLQKGLEKVDDFVKGIYDHLTEVNMTDFTNVLIISDHGMAPTSEKRVIDIDDLVDLSDIEHIDAWPLFGLRPKAKTNLDDMLQNIKDKWSNHPMKDHFQVFSKDEALEKIFQGSSTKFNDDRIAPIWVVPDIGYLIKKKSDDLDDIPDGVHGYSKDENLMRALFMGTGPLFGDLNSRFLQPFDNTEIYNIICQSFSIDQNDMAINNGTTGGIINKDHELKIADWKDDSIYPGVEFPVHILKEKPCYEKIFRKDSKEQGDRPADDKKMPDEEDKEEDKKKEKEQKGQEEGKPQEKEEEKEALKEAPQKAPEELPKEAPEKQTPEESSSEPPEKEDTKSSSWWSKFKDKVEDTVEDAEDYVEDKWEDVEDFVDEKLGHKDSD